MSRAWSWLLVTCLAVLVDAHDYVKLHKYRLEFLVEPEPNNSLSEWIVESDSSHLYLSSADDPYHDAPTARPTSLSPTRPPRRLTYVTNAPTSSSPTSAARQDDVERAAYAFLDYCDGWHFEHALRTFGEALLLVPGRVRAACLDAFDASGKAKISSVVRQLFRTRSNQVVVFGGGTYEPSLVLRDVVRRLARDRIIIVPAGNAWKLRCQDPGGLGGNVVTVSSINQKYAFGSCVDIEAPGPDGTSFAAAYASTYLVQSLYVETGAPTTFHRGVLRQYTDPRTKRAINGHRLKTYLPEFYPYTPQQWYNATCLTFQTTSYPLGIHVGKEALYLESDGFAFWDKRIPFRFGTPSTWTLYENVNGYHLIADDHHLVTFRTADRLELTFSTSPATNIGSCDPPARNSEACILMAREGCLRSASCVWIDTLNGCRQASVCDPDYPMTVCIRLKQCSYRNKRCFKS